MPYTILYLGPASSILDLAFLLPGASSQRKSLPLSQNRYETSEELGRTLRATLLTTHP
jgi:hypothetical protein